MACPPFMGQWMHSWNCLVLETNSWPLCDIIVQTKPSPYMVGWCVRGFLLWQLNRTHGEVFDSHSLPLSNLVWDQLKYSLAGPDPFLLVLHNRHKHCAIVEAVEWIWTRKTNLHTYVSWTCQFESDGNTFSSCTQRGLIFAISCIFHYW